MPTFESHRYQFHRLRHELSNYSLLRLRSCDGLLLSMHQSGTHWLKFMLASAMADHFDIPGPEFNHANDIIGGAKDPVIYPRIPLLRSSHTVAPLLLRNRLALHWLELPPSILLVRDIRASLVSNYIKWQARYAVTFSDYLRGDPSGRRYNSDIWWCFRFLNSWSTIKMLRETNVYLVRYETLRDDPEQVLTEVTRHLAIPLANSSITLGIERATKSAMLKRADPARPPGEINYSNDDPLSAFSASDRRFFSSRCAYYLSDSFGYDYQRWNT
jgi:hypothetical protein